MKPERTIVLGQGLRKGTSLYSVFQQAGARQRYERGQRIHFQGDAPESFYVIERGRLRSYLLAEDGRQITLEVLGPGKLFGQASYFGGVPRPTSAVAETDLEMLAIDYERLLPHLMADRSLVREMFDLMGYSIRLLTLQIGSMAFFSADKRVIQTLLQLRPASGDDRARIPCTHQRVADIAGLNRVTVTRVLRDLAGRGWVRTGRGYVTLLDETALENCLASGGPAALGVE